MPIIQNTAVIPNVRSDFHLLEIEEIEVVEGTKFGEPDVPEMRVKMSLRVRTPGEPDESFTVWMSAKLGRKPSWAASRARPSESCRAAPPSTRTS